MTNKNEEESLIITKRKRYVLPVSASMTWAERYPGSKPPEGYEAFKFWRTPDGFVFAQPEQVPD